MLESASCNSIRPITEQRELTLLFADLRDFTELSAGLEMFHTDLLLGQVMDCLTAAVLDHGGTVVDYYGDGLAAMWMRRPIKRIILTLACGAALDMIETLPVVANKWAGVIDRSLRLGIGLHTGTARVGNAGSTRRTKYGPRGPNVHIASRIETATKEIGVPIIISRATAERLSRDFSTHRVCRARLPGLHEPVDLYSVERHGEDENASSEWQRYKQALEHFEQGRLAEAASILSELDATTGDAPVRFLKERVEQVLGAQQCRRRTDRSEPQSDGIVWFETK